MKAKTHRVAIYGAIGHGPTVKEAKADAGAAIERAFADDGCYIPVLIRFPRGEVGVVYRTLEGWEYGYLTPEQERSSGYCVGGYARKRDAEMHLRRHMAQAYLFQAPDNGRGVIASWDHEGRAAHERYIAWQEGYKALRARGVSDAEARRQLA